MKLLIIALVLSLCSCRCSAVGYYCGPELWQTLYTCAWNTTLQLYNTFYLSNIPAPQSQISIADSIYSETQSCYTKVDLDERFCKEDDAKRLVMSAFETYSYANRQFEDYMNEQLVACTNQGFSLVISYLGSYANQLLEVNMLVGNTQLLCQEYISLIYELEQYIYTKIPPECFRHPEVKKAKRAFDQVVISIGETRSCKHTSFTCPRNTFQCANKFCINEGMKCDTKHDCGDGSDEVNCNRPDSLASCDLYLILSKSYVDCNNEKLQCLHNSNLCDRIVQCRNTTYDEDLCTSKGTGRCITGTYMCSDSTCISRKFLCDGKNDCTDGKDENFCRVSTSETECFPGYFTCTNQKCVSVTARCNGVDDCGDYSDEARCLLYSFQPD